MSQLEIIAERFKSYVPSGYRPIEFVAFAQEFESKLRAGKPPADNYWVDGIVQAARSLPPNADAALNLVKTRAAKVLGDDSILLYHSRREEARIKLEAAQAEASAAFAEEETDRTRKYYREMAERRSDRQREVWGRDWDAEERQAKAVIVDFYGRENMSPFESSTLACAFENVSRIRILREISEEWAVAHPEPQN